MADNNTFQVTYNVGDLAHEVVRLNATVRTAVLIGYGAIVAGGIVSWFLITSSMEMNRTLGKIQAADGPSVIKTLDEINKTLKDLSLQKKTEGASVPQQQGALENLPVMMGGWSGVKADSTEQLAGALLKAPAKGPVWVYTDSADEAAAIEGLLAK